MSDLITRARACVSVPGSGAADERLMQFFSNHRAIAGLLAVALLPAALILGAVALPAALLVRSIALLLAAVLQPQTGVECHEISEAI